MRSGPETGRCHGGSLEAGQSQSSSTGRGRCPPCLLSRRSRRISTRLKPAEPSPGTGESAGHEHSADGAASKDFGPNEWLVDELYQRYLADPGSVDMAWWNFFADYTPPASARGGDRRPAAPAAHGTTTANGTAPATAPGGPAAPAPAPAAAAGPAAGPGARPAAGPRPHRSGRTGGPPARHGPARPGPARRRAAGRPGPARGGRDGQPRPGARRRRPAARRGRPDRRQHGVQPERAHRDQRPDHPGQAAHRQPDRDQQPPGPGPGRQGVVHPPHRVRRGPRAGRRAGDEQLLRGGGRQARPGPAGAHQPGPGHRRDRQGRLAPAAGARGQGGGDHGLPPVLDGVRGRGPAGPHRQAHGGRLRGHHDLADQPGHDRHRALGPPADGRAGLHRRGRRDGVPGRLPGRRRGDDDPAGHQQGGHPHLHLRPPDHPGRAVRGVPAPDPPAAAGRAAASGTRSSRR